MNAAKLISLKNQKEFDLVNKYGKKFTCNYFILVMSKDFSKVINAPISTIFLGIKVSRKLDKRAVIRNKIKRRVRHLIRIVHNNSKFILKDLGIIVIPRKGFDKVEFSALLTEVERIIPAGT